MNCPDNPLNFSIEAERIFTPIGACGQGPDYALDIVPIGCFRICQKGQLIGCPSKMVITDGMKIVIRLLACRVE